MPNNDEMIAVLRLYGCVKIINGDNIIFRRDKCSSFPGTVSKLYNMILWWMVKTTEIIEDSK